MASPGSRRPPLASAYAALSESRFSRAMNWLLAAAGVAYAAWIVTLDWPNPGWLAGLACLGAAAGVWLASVDVHALAMRVLGRLVLRRAVRRRKV